MASGNVPADGLASASDGAAHVFYRAAQAVRPTVAGQVLTQRPRRPSQGASHLAAMVHQRARTILTFAARALGQLRNLTEPPTEETETATL